MPYLVSYGQPGGWFRHLQIGNEEVLRAFPWGTNWNTVRVGVMFAINGAGPLVTAGANIPNAVFGLGMCAGATGGWRSPSANWLGITSANVAGGTALTLTKGAPSFWSSATANAFWSNVNGVYTALTGAANTMSFGSTWNIVPTQANYPPGLFVQWMFQVAKPINPPQTGTAGVYNSFHTAVTQVTNVTRDNFFQGMCTTTAGTGLTASNALSATYAQVGSWPYDTLSIHWNKATPAIDIVEVAAVRLL